MSEHDQTRSVISLRNWLKDEVAIRVDAGEMAYGVDNDGDKEQLERTPRFPGKKNRRTFTTSFGDQRKPDKPPCSFCNGLNHGVWSCRLFEQKPVETRWNFAKEKHLCFRCLSKDHRGKDCRRSQPCNVDGCKLNHHRLLHREAIKPPSPPRLPDPPGDSPREGADPRSTVTVATQSTPVSEESCSLRTVPVRLKANGKKVKVNALLDDASNESFVHENVASLLGIQGSFQKVQVHVLNSKVDQCQSKSTLSV